MKVKTRKPLRLLHTLNHAERESVNRVLADHSAKPVGARSRVMLLIARLQPLTDDAMQMSRELVAALSVPAKEAGQEGKVRNEHNCS